MAAPADTCSLGINGFGRIGRLVLRAALRTPGVRCVAVNDPVLSPEQAAYLFAYDSVHGRFDGKGATHRTRSRDAAADRARRRVVVVEADTKGDVNKGGGALVVDGQRIAFHAERDPSKIPWAAGGASRVIVVESSGVFVEGRAAAAHLNGGAAKVIISAPAKDHETPVLVMGVNHESYDAKSMHVVSNASCTTNCLAPLAKAVHEAFGIEEGLMTTVHAATASQKVVDAPGGKKDWRAGRSALDNIIPASTGAATAVTRVLPMLQGRLNGMALRVPVSDVSVVDLTVRLAKDTTMEQMVAALRDAASRSHGVLTVTDQPVVSSDFIGESASCVFDVQASMALNDRFFKLLAWYDNEYGYALRCVELAQFMASRGE